MATLSNGDWRRVRAAYVEGRETIEAIAGRFGVSASAISRRRKFEGWPPRRNAMPAQAECASAQAQPDGIEPHDGETAPGDLIQRFYNLIKSNSDTWRRIWRTGKTARRPTTSATRARSAH